MTVYVLPAAEQSGPIPIAYPDCAGDVVVNRFEIDLGSAPLKGVTLAQDDILDIGIIPATSQVVDVVIDSDDLDSNGSPTIAFNVGVLTGTPGTTGRPRVRQRILRRLNRGASRWRGSRYCEDRLPRCTR